jgi:hypothetical protein
MINDDQSVEKVGPRRMDDLYPNKAVPVKMEYIRMTLQKVPRAALKGEGPFQPFYKRARTEEDKDPVEFRTMETTCHGRPNRHIELLPPETGLLGDQMNEVPEDFLFHGAFPPLRSNEKVSLSSRAVQTSRQRLKESPRSAR